MSVSPLPQQQRPSAEAYAELQRGFDHFNAELFAGELPCPLFTFQRKKRVQGYFAHDRFVSRSSGAHVAEIAMNPVYFVLETPEQTMQTLVHEMAHLWQETFGKPGRRGYHNREWAAKMESIGLMPSSTGRDGGKKTGERMSDYVIRGGLFEASCARLLSSAFRVTWVDRYPPRSTLRNAIGHQVIKTGADEVDDEAEQDADLAELGVVLSDDSKSRRYQRKYRCEEHDLNVWGKPKLAISCGHCLKPLQELSL